MSGTDEFIPDSDPEDNTPLEPIDASEPEFAPEVIERASKYGWQPKDRVRDPTRWVPPDRYLELTGTRLKIMSEVAAEADKRAERAETMARNTADMVRRQERAAAEERLAAIRAEKYAAVESSDTERYKELEEIERRWQQPRPQQQEVPAEVTAYRSSERGKWLEDPEMVRFAADAIQASPEALAKGPADQMEWVEGRARRFYPHLFKAAEPEAQRDQHGRFSKVDGGGLASPKSRPNLSAEDRAHIAEGIRKGVYKDEAEAVAYARSIGVLE